VKGHLKLRRARLIAFMFEPKTRPSVVRQGSALIWFDSAIEIICFIVCAF